MSLTHDDVVKILKLIDESNYDEVRLEIGDLKLHVQKHDGARRDVPAEPAAERITARAATVAATGTVSAAAPPPAPAVHEAAGDEATTEGLVPVRSPMLGTFYRAPAPGEKPFVEVGDKVGANDTVCLVEVMKLFNSVKAGMAGTVAKILVENAAMVEHDQPLVLIDPERPRPPGEAQ